MKERKKKGEGLKERLSPKGRYIIETIDKKTGKVAKKVEADNLVVDAGKAKMAERLRDNSDGFSIIDSPRLKIGLGGTAPTAGDTDLINVYETADTIDNNTWDGTNNKRIVQHTFTDFTETKNICEAGYFIDYSSLYSRVTFPSVEINELKNLRVTIYLYP